MSIEDQLFLSSISNQKETNLQSAKKKFKKRFAGDIPKTVQEYADANNLTLADARKELKAKNIRLGGVDAKRDNVFQRFFGADYDYKPQELELVDGRYMPVNRPKGVGRFATGLLDFMTLGVLDTDQQGGGPGGMITGYGYGEEDFNQKISKSGQKELLTEKVNEAMEDVEFDVLGNVVGGTGTGSGSSGGTVMDQIMDYKKKSREFERKERRKDMVDNQLNYLATEPMRQAFANRAAEAAAQRGLRIRAAKEAMPSNIQNIMLSKQAQAATASSAEAERARAAADQQDAATRFAGLGMQRRFG